MKRNSQIDATYLINGRDLIKKIVFYEAGHATAIYLYNKQRQLPSASFQITVKALEHSKNSPLEESYLLD